MRRTLVGFVVMLIALLALVACGSKKAEVVAPATSSTTTSTSTTTTVLPATTVSTTTVSTTSTTTIQPTSTTVTEVQERVTSTQSFGSCDFASQPAPVDHGDKIMIDSIGLDLPLLSGLTEEMTSPSWCTTSSGFGQSGFSIVGGHRTSHGAAFRHLPEVSIGDTIVIVSNGSRFEYRVTEAPVSYTEADAAKVLQGTASRNILKLFTCGPNPGESTARWIVTAKLVKVG